LTTADRYEGFGSGPVFPTDGKIQVPPYEHPSAYGPWDHAIFWAARPSLRVFAFVAYATGRRPGWAVWVGGTLNALIVAMILAATEVWPQLRRRFARPLKISGASSTVHDT